MILVNIVGQPKAIGFIPPLAQKYIPLFLIKLDENDEPVRDPKTGLVERAKPGEQGELVGEIVDGQAGREFKGYAGDEANSKKKILKDVKKKGDSYFRSGTCGNISISNKPFCNLFDATQGTSAHKTSWAISTLWIG